MPGWYSPRVDEPSLLVKRPQFCTPSSGLWVRAPNLILYSANISGDFSDCRSEHHILQQILPIFILIMTSLKILIVDDERDYCMIMKSYFAARKYDVFVAYTLQEGLDKLEESRPDILLIDNNFPDGKGKDQIDPILQKFPELKIFLISAYYQ